MGLNRDFWSKQRVLLTGDSGFKGAWLRLWLQEMGATVIGFSLSPLSEPALDSVFPPAAIIRRQDLRRRALIESVIQEEHPSIVIHMAAQSLVRESYRKPFETFETNFISTLNLLDVCRNQQDIKAILVVTSDKCYRNMELAEPFTEQDPLGGEDPYSASKACVEILSHAYLVSFRDQMSPLATVRAGNVIGGGDWAEERLIPDVMRAIYEKCPLLLRHPHAIRPWQHVLEPLYGYLRLAEEMAIDPAYAGSWNFGPAESAYYSVKTLVDRMISEEQSSLVQFDIEESPFYEANILRLDSSKSFQHLNWKTKLSFEETVDWTSDWYAHYYAQNKNIVEFSQEQIRRYEEKWQ